MLPRLLRLSLVLGALVLFFGALPFAATVAGPQAALAQSGNDPDRVKLQRLAAATGHDADRLQLADESAVTLLNGRRLVRLKAIDPATGEIVGATFEGERAVDERALRAEAGAQWRATHGALTPELVKRLSTMRPDDTLDIAVWLAVDVESLPKPEHRPASQTTTGAPATADPAGSQPLLQTEAAAAGSEKTSAVPVPLDQIPADLRSRLGLAASGAPNLNPDVAKSPAEAEQQASDAAPPVSTSSEMMEQVKAYEALNDAAIRAQIAPVRTRFLDALNRIGLTAGYASESVPSVYLSGVTRQQVEEMARWPEVDAIYAVSTLAGPSLANARPSQNALLINLVGYDGNGVSVAVVEGERAFFANPYLDLAAAYDGGQPFEPHPTGVAGIIKSSHPIQKGLAYSATVYSANGSYSNFGVMAAAIDWGRQQATVLNNSWYWDVSSNNPAFWEADRRLDYIVRYNFDFVAVASGNFGNGCTGIGGFFTNYVPSPAKGYNVLSVGNYDDQDTLGWSDDVMSFCSSFGDPGSDTSSPTHAKPEVAAIGSIISSTITSSPWIGGIGSGTSYASPMVSALAADLIEADSNLVNRPEVLRSILMATALHNIEGNARLSDVDGTGGIDATAAIATVERGNWADESVGSGTTFPITYTQFVYEGERVRFVINWLSNPDAGYTTDPLPADLDLRAYGQNGTLIASSLSSNNNFEIVDFVAPASEVYQFVVSRFGSWTGGSTWLGSGWWRGTYRVVPDTGYSDPAASPLGTHLSVYPTDWSPTNYWRAFGIRSLGTSDHDLTLSTASWFDDPTTRSFLAGSYYAGSTVDFTVVDGNHRSPSLPEHYRVNLFSGSGGYGLSWSNQGIALINPGLYGPYSMGSSVVVRVFDVWFTAGETRRISVIPTSGTNDLAVELFRSNGVSAATWTQGHGNGVASADAYGAGMDIERLKHTASNTDWLGLVVFTRNQASTSFYILVEDLKVFLPVVLKNY